MKEKCEHYVDQLTGVDESRNPDVVHTLRILGQL